VKGNAQGLKPIEELLHHYLWLSHPVKNQPAMTAYLQIQACNIKPKPMRRGEAAPRVSLIIGIALAVYLLVNV